jgi:cellobiose phosphorylase
LLTLVTRVFGIYGILGDLAIEPKLVSEQFDLDGNAGLSTLFAGRMLDIIYKNPMRLEYGEYRVGKISLNGMPVTRSGHSGITVLPRAVITALDNACSHQLMIELDKQ